MLTNKILRFIFESFLLQWNKTFLKAQTLTQTSHSSKFRLNRHPIINRGTIVASKY